MVEPSPRGPGGLGRLVGGGERCSTDVGQHFDVAGWGPVVAKAHKSAILGAPNTRLAGAPKQTLPLTNMHLGDTDDLLHESPSAPSMSPLQVWLGTASVTMAWLWFRRHAHAKSDWAMAALGEGTILHCLHRVRVCMLSCAIVP